jgi:hypothetical protein
MVETIMIGCLITKLPTFALSCHLGSTKWQGERIRGKNGAQKDHLCNDFKIIQAFRYCQDGLCQVLARWGKNKLIKCFVVCLKNKLQPHNNGTSGGTMPTVLVKVGVIK